MAKDRMAIFQLARSLGLKPVQPVKSYEHRKHGALYYMSDDTEDKPRVNLESIARACD